MCSNCRYGEYKKLVFSKRKPVIEIMIRNDESKNDDDKKMPLIEGRPIPTFLIRKTPMPGIDYINVPIGHPPNPFPTPGYEYSSSVYNPFGNLFLYIPQ